MDSLLAMGFDESTARRAMEASQGDVESAADLLLSGSLEPSPAEIRARRLDRLTSSEGAIAAPIVARPSHPLPPPHASTASFSSLGRGLVNLGNTCFFNATVQALVHNPSVRQCIDRGPHIDPKTARTRPRNVRDGFARFAREMWHGGSHSLNPSVLFDLVSERSPQFRDKSVQQDAQELLRCLLDHVSTDEASAGVGHALGGAVARSDMQMREARLARLGGGSAAPEAKVETKASQDSEAVVTWIDRVFGGGHVMHHQCGGCGRRRQIAEEFYDISLPLPPRTGSPRTVEDCLREFTASSRLPAGEGPKCPGCSHTAGGTAQYQIAKLPRCLTLHVKRFNHIGGQHGGFKRDDFVKFAPWLDVRAYMATNYDPLVNALQGQTGSGGVLDPEAPWWLYSLHAVVVHRGQLGSGHYTVFVREGHQPDYPDRSGERRWTAISDEKREGVQEFSVLAAQAYLLFYSRVCEGE